MKTLNILRNINETAANISMYVGLIFVVYSMLKNNDFAQEPEITAIIVFFFVLFSIFRFISYKFIISDIRNNKDSFIRVEIDNRK